jgi:hypothetical protein
MQGGLAVVGGFGASHGEFHRCSDTLRLADISRHKLLNTLVSESLVKRLKKWHLHRHNMMMSAGLPTALWRDAGTHKVTDENASMYCES